MKPFFITGGAGFIGSHIAEELGKRGLHPVVFDNLTTGRMENLEGIPHTFIEGDVRDLPALIDAMKGCASVFHLAALTSVVESMQNPDDYIAVNVFGTLNVLKAARESNVKKVVFSSSAAVYGDSPILPKTEDMTPQPKSPYAITKLDGEYYCSLYRECFGLSTACARFFNVFGERQDPASAYAAAVPIFIKKAVQSEPIRVYGDGTQTRDFIDVKDVANALIFLMERAEGIYNIGYGKAIAINSLVEIITGVLHSTSRNVHVPERPGEIKHSCASVDKILQLGFEPGSSLKDGLARTIKWFEGRNGEGRGEGDF